MSKVIKYKGQTYIRQDTKYKTLNDARKDILVHLNKALAIMEDVGAESQILTYLPIADLRNLAGNLSKKIAEVEKRNELEAKKRAYKIEQKRKEIAARKAN